MEFLVQHIEALIFATEHPISLAEMKSVLDATFETEFEEAELLSGVEDLKVRYAQDQFSFEVIEIAGGFQFLTKPTYHNSVGMFLKQTMKKRLSQAALETLSIVAYKQPVSKTELEQIRGVSCDYALQKLLEKELVDIQGRSEAPGRPLLYGTSEKFMDYFGIKSLIDLPKPKDFKEVENQIGEASPIEEVS
jgi:segregation and condensation protein B